MTRTHEIRFKVKRLNGLLYKLFSHRYLVAFVVFATLALLAQVSIMSFAFALSVHGANTLESAVNGAIALQNITVSVPTSSLTSKQTNQVQNTYHASSLYLAEPRVASQVQRLSVRSKDGSSTSKEHGVRTIGGMNMIRRQLTVEIQANLGPVNALASSSSSLSSAILDGSQNPNDTYFKAESADGKIYTLSLSCAAALVSPYKAVVRLHRADVAIIVFQLWVWALLMFGLALESVPHLFAVIFSHLLNIVSTGLQFHSIRKLRDEYDSIIDAGACKNADMLPHFWGIVVDLEITALALECVTIVGLTLLALKVYSVLDWRTFRKLGASKAVRTIHTIGLLLTILLHLNAYFGIAFQAIWLSESFSHPWSPDLHDHGMAFQVTLIILISLTIPWLLLGSIANTDKMMFGMTCFIVFDLALLLVNIFLLSGEVYQSAAGEWAILSFLGITSCTLLFSTLIVAAACMILFPARGTEALSSGDAATSKATEWNKRAEVAFPGEVAAFSVHTDPWTHPKLQLPPGADLSGEAFPPYEAPAQRTKYPRVQVQRSNTASSWSAGDERSLTDFSGRQQPATISRFSAATTNERWSNHSDASDDLATQSL